ncbi:hypothetical protein K493DRAFT_314503 [Basidiobolus meristosporus CBS 931.73]|uniref:Uncharacterized protein n=1 Tax=Basidiobolus meristosporus CBS 931.73 TaxID=1314790 RepID=A0A1Y1YFG9_9FUNG|nr:hypothetical protein K493DRAFT_314503 [Basidiobolus meristosporus CBS 931.73]|eukprot:ORX96446.1 hypothetical protein K493DRAFT_314503 [Basidiobolus meristosporus CBS 931.73]
MGLIERIQGSYLFTHWKTRKYTKRRGGCHEIDRRDANYYQRNYSDGVYRTEDLSSLGPQVPPPPPPVTNPSVLIRSSEAYTGIC